LKADSTSSHTDAGQAAPVREYGSMGKKSENWPRPFQRRYPSGRIKYCVYLGKQGDKKQCRPVSFDTAKERDEYIGQARKARDQQGQVPFFLPFHIQSQAVALHEFLKPHGITFEDVRSHYVKDIIPFRTAPNVEQIARQLIAEVNDKGSRDSWSKTLCGFLEDFSRTFGCRKITDITKDEIRDFCFQPDRTRPYEPKTKRNRRGMAAELYNFAINNDWAEKNIAIRLPCPRLKDKLVEILVLDQVHRLLLVADEFGFLGYAVVCLFGGVRPEECQELSWEYVHVDDGVIEITEAVSKIHRAREVEINPTMAAWLSLCRRESGPIVGATNLQGRFDAWRAAANIDDWPHDALRRTFASNHVAAFKNAAKTAEQMGHIDGLRTLYKHYVRFVPKKAADQYWAIRPRVFEVTGKLAA
jgi:integrase